MTTTETPTKPEIHAIIDKWVRQARQMGKLAIVQDLWYLKDFIDGICVQTSEPIARRLLSELKDTEEARKVRGYVDELR